MKKSRRKFFKKMGLTIGSGLIAPHLYSSKLYPQKYEYPPIDSLKDASNKFGEIAIRLAYSNPNDATPKIQNIKVKLKGKGVIKRTKTYFLEPPDQHTSSANTMSTYTADGDMDVMVVWLKDVLVETQLIVSIDKTKHKITLAKLLDEGEMSFNNDYLLTLNFLGYNEIGTLNLKDLNLSDKENYRFVILADTQGGDPYAPQNDSPTRTKIHNAFIEETVARVNELDPAPEFVLVLGDFVDSKGQEEHFREMERLIKPLKTPVLLEVGNHETPYKADFTPAYNMTDLNNFFESQKRLNGTDKILYSFNLGKWHIIVWPDPLRNNFWSTHPHYFDWLENDLEENRDRPTLFMHHVPLHPIGIDPLTAYVESVSVKQLLIKILTKHGNVKYTFSGHVHIPLKASVKTAVNHGGINMINLPAAGFRARAFGEEDYFGGPEQGQCVIDINGENIKVHFEHVTKEWFTYPNTFRPFDNETFALWYNQPWQLKLNDKLTNGNFLKGLNNWHLRYVYHEDEDPSNKIHVIDTPNEGKALYLYSRKRGYDVPGQDRLPQYINQIVQAVSLKKVSNPVLEIDYQLQEGHFDPNSLNGFFIWLECYSNSENVANLIYSAGKVYGNITAGFGSHKKIKTHHFDLQSNTGVWNKVSLPIAKDFDKVNNKTESFANLKADRVVVHLGTWTINEGMNQEVGVYIKNIDLISKAAIGTTKIKNISDIWYWRITNISGEHHYINQEEVYPKGLKGKT